MTAALFDLSSGTPQPFLDSESDARWWADLAAPAELVAVLGAVLDRLGDRAMHLDMRKRLFLKLWKGFGPEDRSRFLAFAQGAAQ